MTNKANTDYILGSKLPPHSNESEIAVLGSCLIDKSAIEKSMSILNENDFYNEAHKEIYSAIVVLFENELDIDIVTLPEYLNHRKQLESVGGAYYIADITTRTPTAANVIQYSHIVKEKALKRQMISDFGQLIAEAYDEEEDVFELIMKYQNKAIDLTKNITTGNLRHISEYTIPFFNKILEAQEGINKEAIPTTNYYINRLLKGGFMPGKLIYYAATPGQGKSAKLVDEINNAEKYRNVCLYSLEMPADEFLGRLVANKEAINSYYFEGMVNKKLDKIQLERIDKRMSKLKNSNIFVDESPFWHIDKLRMDIKRIVKEYDIGIVFVDYIQLVDGTRKDRNREQEVNYVARTLKGIAKENYIPIVCAAQFGRNTYNKKPTLKDLRESAGLEQAADIVIGIYTPLEQTKDEDSDIFDTELLVLKNRGGKEHFEKVKWDKSTYRFVSISQHPEPNQEAMESYYEKEPNYLDKF